MCTCMFCLMNWCCTLAGSRHERHPGGQGQHADALDAKAMGSEGGREGGREEGKGTKRTGGREDCREGGKEGGTEEKREGRE